MRAFVQRLHKIDTWETNDKLSDRGLLNLAIYLFREGFIKVNTEWDEEKQCNVTHYSIEAAIKEEVKNDETNDKESSEDNIQKRKGFFERLFG